MKNDIHIYVAPNGNDSADGTISAPLATLKGARDRLRSLGAKCGAVVTFLEGVYEFRDSVEFNETDGGTKDAPVVYEAKGNVVFSGGAVIGSEKIGAVTDEAMKKRLPDADRVKAVDLRELALSKDTLFGTAERQPRFFAGNMPYENARFPNREKITGKGGPYLYSKKIIFNENEDKSGFEIQFFYDDENVGKRMAKWSAEAYEDMYIYGYFWHQWVYNVYKGICGDPERGVLKAGTKWRGYDVSGESEGKNRRQFISNLPEELDAEGEYYYDRKKATLYFIPNEDYEEGMPVTISLFNASAVKTDKAENIVFRGIKFSYFVYQPITVQNSDGIVFENCEISHTSHAAATVTNSLNCRFISCDIFDTASGGVYFEGCGDRYNLIESGSAVENCVIKDINRILTCYRPAVHFKNGCGLSVRKSTLSDAPHALIILEHINDVLIEDNRIVNACLDTDDASAVYWGRDPSDIGIVIRHNYFANIGNKAADYSISAIYVDDWATCCEVYNNIFFNCGILSGEKMTEHTNANAIVLNNAQFLNAYNNLFIGTYRDQKPTNLYPCSSFARWITLVNGIEPAHLAPSEVSWYDTLVKAGFLTQKWKDHYKNSAWAGMWDCVNEDVQKKISDYKKNHADESDKKIYVDMAWAAFDNAWDHVTEDGETFEGTLLEYVQTAYADELKDKLADYENNSPTQGSGIDGFLFWKAVLHKLKFRTTNTFVNNVAIGMDRAYLTQDEHLKGHVMNGFYQNYVPANDKLPDGSSMFVDYGSDFSLTTDAIVHIHKYLPLFHNISMIGMGADR